MKKYIAIISVMMSIAAMPVFALDLQAARASGVVGETQNGYVEALGGGGEAAMLAAEVNAKRKAEYARISAENGQAIDVVAKIAAGKIIAGLPKGAQYQDAKGKWVQK